MKFERLTLLPASTVRKGLISLVPWEIALAVKTCEARVRDFVLECLPDPGERKEIEILIKHIGRVRVTDVDWAQNRLLDALNEVKAPE